MTETVHNFRDLTTIRVGGPIENFVTVSSTEAFAAAVEQAWAEDEDWFILGGGSNLVATETGFQGTVIADRTAEIAVDGATDAGTMITVSSGYNWDDCVAWTVAHGYSGIEALSGIPGNVGAAPVQNIGAYGTELSSVLHSIDFLDYLTGERSWVSANDLELGYRTSTLKRGRRGAVLRVRLLLHKDPLSTPIGYQQLATRLGTEIGARRPLVDVRNAVIALRASKGMVLNPADGDSISAGSFFTNPIVPVTVAGTLPAHAPRWPVDPEPMPDIAIPISVEGDFAPSEIISDVAAEVAANRVQQWQTGTSQVKLSAAWLIEHSGIPRGFRLPGSAAAISSKHTLAIVNTGYATGEQVAELARYVQSRVAAEFGVVLVPEPLLMGLSL